MNIDKQRLEHQMVWMGFREVTQGTPMLRDAVEMWHPGVAMTKELYPAIAKKYGTTASRAERCMRFAIEAAAQRGNSAKWGEIFGHSVFAAVDAPTVSDFISRMQRVCGRED